MATSLQSAVRSISYWACGSPLLRIFDAGCFDDAIEFCRLALEELNELLGCAGDDCHAVTGKTLFKVGRIEDARHFLLQFCDDIARRAAGHQQTIPVGHVES